MRDMHQILIFSITAVARIQHALRTNKLDEAIALFRASRYIYNSVDDY